MDEALVSDLRWLEKASEDDATNVYGRAADRIEQLEQEVARLKACIWPDDDALKSGEQSPKAPAPTD